MDMAQMWASCNETSWVALREYKYISLDTLPSYY